MDAKDLQRRWKEVLKTCGLELNTAAPGDKAKWVKAALSSSPCPPEAGNGREASGPFMPSCRVCQNRH